MYRIEEGSLHINPAIFNINNLTLKWRNIQPLGNAGSRNYCETLWQAETCVAEPVRRGTEKIVLKIDGQMRLKLRLWTWMLLWMLYWDPSFTLFTLDGHNAFLIASKTQAYFIKISPGNKVESLFLPWLIDQIKQNNNQKRVMLLKIFNE